MVFVDSRHILDLLLIANGRIEVQKGKCVHETGILIKDMTVVL